MDVQFRCENEARRNLVRDHATLNGIDFLEVLDQRMLVEPALAGLPRQQFLLVRLLKAAPDLDATNVRLERLRGAAEAGVAWARRADLVTTVLPSDLDSGDTLTGAEAAYFNNLDDADEVLVVLTTGRGDYSTYTLRLVASPTEDTPPPTIDPRLAAISFSFKVECPSDFDCAPEDACPPETFDEPEIDYLAKDYASFRRLMLDRLSVVMPDWQDRSPADMQIALVEMLAYVGDHLSYYQDAVATEAYLGTARRRTSVRRHARLLDYFMHDGCNARAWVHFAAEAGGAADGLLLPAGAELRTRGEDYLVFETMHDLALSSGHNEIPFYTWSDTDCCLPAGSTRATLLDDPPGALNLSPGDVLIFEEVVGPTNGLEADADPAHRHVVRLAEATPTTDDLDGTGVVEIAWHEQDALPFPLCLSVVVDGAVIEDVSLARGNVALADQGRSIAGERLIPQEVSVGRYRPRLPESRVTFAAEYEHETALQAPAALAVRQDPRDALPQVRLDDGDELWRPRRDLLGSDRFAAEFVVETERDRRAYLRFGDDVLGKAPSAGDEFSTTFRVGNGPAGNVGAEAIALAVGVGGVSVRNPLPAEGGTAPERIKEVRQFAPQAFRTQERAVTEADYAEVAERHEEVQKAAATFRWTGSWYTVFVTIDRKGGLPVREDTRFHEAMQAHLGRYRLAGYDLEINDPVFVPLDLQFEVCVASGYFRSDVKRALLDAFSRFDLQDGRRGFFHPDRFTFGQPVYLSQLYEAAVRVAGVASVEVTRFQRLNKNPDGELQEGVLVPASLEVLRLDNDPSNPENGKLELEMLGGI